MKECCEEGKSNVGQVPKISKLRKKSAMKEVSFEWLNPKILSRDSKVVQLKYKSAKKRFCFSCCLFFPLFLL